MSTFIYNSSYVSTVTNGNVTQESDLKRQQSLLIAMIIIEGSLLMTCCGVCIWKYFRSKRQKELAEERRRERSDERRRSRLDIEMSSKQEGTHQNDLVHETHGSSTSNLLSSTDKTHEGHDQNQNIAKAVFIGGNSDQSDSCQKSFSGASQLHGVTITTSSQKKKFSQVSGVTSNNVNTSTFSTTMARSDVELSIPGYLEVQYGQDFTVSRLLTKGGAASVYLAKTDHLRLRKYGKVVVLKQLQPNATTPEAIVRDAFHQELAIMWYFRQNEHFMKVLGYTESPMSFISKFYPDGSLDRMLRKKKCEITKSLILLISKGVAIAMTYMHTAGFIHCDLKSGNILLDRNAKNEIFPILSDFGISQIMELSTMLVKDFPVIYNNAFSFNYAAPEVFSRLRRHQSVADVPGEVGKALDVYSFGCILYEMLIQYPPWTVITK